jgi:VanZ family protein
MRRPASGSLILALLFGAFILYGSLYPFRFQVRPFPGGALGHLLTTWRAWDHPTDLLSNVLLYMPLGFVAMNALPARWPAIGRAAVVLSGGIALSVFVELAQFYDRTRDSTLGDVYANAIGTGIGVVLAGVLRYGADLRWLRPLDRDQAAALILAAWFGYRAYPYVPTIGLRAYVHALARVVLDPFPGALEVLHFAAAWLLIAALARALYGRRDLAVFGLLVAAEFAVRVMVVDASLSLKDVLGAALAGCLWRGLRGWRRGEVVVAIGFAAMLAADRLSPFAFASAPVRDFGWVPFLSFMRGSTGVDVQAFCEKTFAYGGLIWLGRRAGLGLAGSSALTAALLAGTSLAQVWVPGRSAEITDAVLAVGIGAVMRLLAVSP